MWSFVVNLDTNSLCVLIIVYLSTGCEESQYNAVLSQGIICGFGAGRPGAGQTLAAHPRRSIPRALVAGLGTLDYAACGHRGGLGGKPILLINGEFRAETPRCSKCDHLLHDGSVRLDFMTDDVNEAEKMRIQTLASDCMAEIRNLNESGWVAVRGGCWQTRPPEVPS